MTVQTVPNSHGPNSHEPFSYTESVLRNYGASARGPADAPATGPGQWLLDAWLIAERNLRRIVRSPDLLFTLLFLPVMYWLFFRYVFGGAINPPGGNYTQFLLPGMIVAIVTWVTVPSMAVGVGTDLQTGLIDRFRSLPMTRSSVLIGRTVSEATRNLAGILVLLPIGYVSGFRFRGGPLEFIGTIGLALLFGLALAWMAAFVAMYAKSPEAAQSMATIWLVPIGFISSIYVPTETMPAALRVFADANPLTHVTNAVRGWSNGQPVGSTGWLALAWCVGIIAVFGFLSVRRFQQTR